MPDGPDAVTFDFHNTLARCDKWFQLEIRDLPSAFLSWHSTDSASTLRDEVIEQSITIYRRIRTEVMDHGNELDAASCIDAVTRELGILLEPETIERGLRHVMMVSLADLDPVPGAICSIKALRARGVKLGVVSSAAYHPFLEWSLEKFGVLDDFHTIVTSARCGYYKSRAEIYSIALDELGARADRTVHVGDSHRFDVETASSLGIRTVWYDPERNSANGHDADAVVHTLVGVEDVITELMNGRRS